MRFDSSWPEPRLMWACSACIQVEAKGRIMDKTAGLLT